MTIEIDRGIFTDPNQDIAIKLIKRMKCLFASHGIHFDSKETVLDLNGYTQQEICENLQLGNSAISGDIQFLRQHAQENLQKHIHEVVPEEYQKCMVGMKRNLRQTLEIRDNASDPKVKLQAVAIANDCYKFILDMSTNAGIV